MKPSDPPQPGALLSLGQARAERRCRICGGPVAVGGFGVPAGWTEQFGEICYPAKLTLNFGMWRWPAGEEFAHTECLRS